MAQSPYTYPKIPVNKPLAAEYGFTVPEQSTSLQQYGLHPTLIQNYPCSKNSGDGYSTPQFTKQLLAQPVVTDIAVQYGNSLVGSGKQHLEKYIPVTALKYYFAVDNDYVITRLALLFMPFNYKDWAVKYEQDVPLQPRYEKNAPDMYIPTMAFLTYVVTAGLVLGTQDRFTPEQLGTLASSALAWGVMELVVHTISLYVMNLDTSLRTLDLLAYCGYKYVGINASLVFSLVLSRFGYYIMLLYFSASLAFFLMQSLKLRVIPQNQSSYTASGNRRRHYFILFVAGIQPVLMWWLSYHLI